MLDSQRSDVTKLYASWLMPLPLFVHIVSRQIDSNGAFFDKWIESESGLIENLTVVVLIPAIIFAALAAKRFLQHGFLLLTCWYLGVMLVCLGFGGEEASWGQHWVGWESPDYFADRNRQGETNFHNFDIQLGRIVKTILTLLIIIGGLIWPLFINRDSVGKFTPKRLLDTIAATGVAIPAATYVFAIRLVERLKTWFDLEWSLLAVNLKELQELYIALFLFIYAWSMHIRAKRNLA